MSIPNITMIDSALMSKSYFAEWLEKKFLDWQYLNGRASMRKFSKWLEIDHALISQMMNGKLNPGPKTLPKLADKFGYVVYDVVGLPRPDADEEELIRRYRTIPPEKRAEYSQALREFTQAWAANHGYELDHGDNPEKNHQDK